MSDTTGASGQSGAPGASGQSGGTPEPGANTGATFTQEQVDAFLAEERRRTNQKYGDYDALKARVGELEGASQSELEKANAKAQDAARRAEAAVAKSNTLQIRTALIAEAAKQGAVDPDLIATLCADQLGIDKEGNLEGKPDRVVQKFLEERPYLRANGRVGGSVDGGRHTTGGGKPETANEQMDSLLRKNR